MAWLFGKKKAAAPADEENFISHLVELRDRVIRSLIVILLLFFACFYVAPDLMKFLARPLQEALPPGSNAVFIAGEGAFFTLTKMALLTAVLLSLPWVLYQAWAFVSPGLYAHEKRFAGPLIVLSVIFLVLGIAFAYFFVLPVAYKFFFSFAEKTGADVMQDLQRYWDFTLSIFFGFGLAFEVPVVVMLMIKLGIVSVEGLREARRYVIVGAFVVAAVLTPPDVLSQFMLAVPLMLLYELGIFLGGFLATHSQAPDDLPDDPGEEGALTPASQHASTSQGESASGK
ncbi:MAG: twin-arginine translocase subunit TatC [Lautropia sp.]|nr:twin-arginine translocase subunit TatC [Lautropia sp.]